MGWNPHRIQAAPEGALSLQGWKHRSGVGAVASEMGLLVLQGCGSQEAFCGACFSLLGIAEVT